MTADILGLYNDALTHLGERRLVSLTENREPRRKLDAVYAFVLDECLQSGYWKHARRTIKMTNASVVPAFGYSYAYDLPVDFLQIYLVSQSPDGSPPLNDWIIETGYLRANFETLHMTYISNSNGFGASFDHWSPLFARWVGMCLAERIAFSISQDERLADRLEKRAMRYKRSALSRDAASAPPRSQPVGSWVTSRHRTGSGTGRG